jgi:hypothetical protein
MDPAGLTPDPLAVAIAAGVLVVVFARGLWHKLADHALFRVTMADYGLLPEKAVAPAAAALAVAEAAIVIGLVVPATRGPAAVAAAGLLGLYALAIAINLGRGHVTIDCGCGGPGHGLSWLLVWRNALLAGVAGLAAMAPVDRTLGLADAVWLVLAVATATLVIAVVEQAASNAAYVWLHRNGRL